MQGIAVVSESLDVIVSLGVCANDRIRKIISDPDWVARARAKRLLPIPMDDGPLIAYAAPVESALLVMITNAPPDTVLRFLSSVDFAYDIFEHVLTDPYDAMVVVDANEKLSFISPVHERAFGLEPGGGTGRHVFDIIKESRLPHVLRTGHAEVGQILDTPGGHRVVSRHPIKRDGRIVGAIGRVMFKGPEQIGNLLQKVDVLERQLAAYRADGDDNARADHFLDAIIGQSVAIQSVRKQIRKIAPLDVPVLIEGESGTGKELVARALHMLSPRHEGQLVNVNAAALPANLVEAELFGYEAGSFTGADRKGRRGKFELADKGTIFFDEIGDMPIETQLKLMRVLQERVVEKVGSNRQTRVDFRLVSATNRDLQALMEQGSFRLDLFFRISPVRIFLPALSERIEDIPLLLHHFIREMCEKYARPAPEIALDVPQFLMSRPWPGNIRQLRHEVERAFVFSENGRIGIDDFVQDASARDSGSVNRHVKSIHRPAGDSTTFQEAVEQLASDLIADAMIRFNGNKKRVAENLGISRSFLYKKLGEELKL